MRLYIPQASARLKVPYEYLAMHVARDELGPNVLQACDGVHQPLLGHLRACVVQVRSERRRAGGERLEMFDLCVELISY